MSLTTVLAALEKSVLLPANAPAATAIAAASTRHRALAPFPTPRALVSAIAPKSPLPDAERTAVLTALLEESRAPGAGAAVFSCLLLLAFSPLLLGFRARLARPQDEDLDQEVLLAFLETAKRVSTTDRPWLTPLRLKSGMKHRVFDRLRKSRRGGPTISYDDDTDSAITIADIVADDGAHRVVDLLETVANADIRKMILATLVDEEPLDAYVARLHPTLKPRARESMVARLRRQRREALEQIAERAAKPPMLIEDAAFTPA